MYHWVGDVCLAVVAAGGPNITLGVIVGFEIAIYTCGQCVSSNVKLSSVIEQWILNVLLNDVRPSSIPRRSLNDALDVLVVLLYGNATASVCVLAWLDDPY